MCPSVGSVAPTFRRLSFSIPFSERALNGALVVPAPVLSTRRILPALFPVRGVRVFSSAGILPAFFARDSQVCCCRDFLARVRGRRRVRQMLAISGSPLQRDKPCSHLNTLGPILYALNHLRNLRP